MRILCIGGNCEGHDTIKILDQQLGTHYRIRGPLDNLSFHSFRDVDYVLSGKFFGRLDKYKVVTYDGNYRTFEWDNIRMIHNDWETDKVKQEFSRRIRLFLDALGASDVWYMYAPAAYDEYISEQEIENTFNKYPYLRGRTFCVVSGRYKISPCFEKMFTIFKAAPWDEEPEKIAKRWKEAGYEQPVL